MDNNLSKLKRNKFFILFAQGVNLYFTSPFFSRLIWIDCTPIFKVHFDVDAKLTLMSMQK